MKKNVLIYVRVSSEDQRKTGTIDAQLSACREWCKGQKAHVIKEVIDDGISGASLDRAVRLGIVLEEQKGNIDTLLVESLDRLSRDTQLFGYLVTLCKQFGVKLFSIAEGAFNLETLDPVQEFQMTLLQALATMKKKEFTLKMKKRAEDRAREGFKPRGQCPFGYRWQRIEGSKRHTVVIDESEAEAVRFLFKAFKKKKSYSKAARLANEKGFRHRRRKGRGKNEVKARLFTRQAVKVIIQNPFYKGKLVYKGEVFEGQHEPM